MAHSPISKLKVIELSSVLAGPAVGMFFAELGATVIKIENKTVGGDMTRKWKNVSENGKNKISAYFSSVNYKKTYILADFYDERERESVFGLLKTADIVLVNFKKGDDKKFGFDYDYLKEINPGIIYAHITGYGANEEKTAFDAVLQAETGFMYMNGTPQSGPVKMPVALIDILAAHQLKEAILLALLKRSETGKGAYVHVSLYETAIASLANQASNYLMTGMIPGPMGTLHPNIAPYGELIQSADGTNILLAVGNDAQFFSLCKALDLNETAASTHYTTNNLRVRNREELIRVLNVGAAKFNTAELEQRLVENGVPHARINNLQQVFENPLAKKMVLEEEIENTTTRRVSTIAFNKDFLHD